MFDFYRATFPAQNYDCKFTAGCACAKIECSRCGHNPEVAKVRTKAIMERMQREALNGKK